MKQVQQHSGAVTRGWRSPRPQVLIATALVSSVLVAGCSDPRANDLCTQYEQVTSRAAEIRDLDPAAVSVEDLRSQLASFQASLDQLQAVAEGRLDTAISELRSAVRDSVQAAVDAGKEAVETARPLLDESLGDVDERWAALQQKVDVECDVA